MTVIPLLQALLGIIMSTAQLRLEADISHLLRPISEVCRRKHRRFLLPMQAPGLLTLPRGAARHVWVQDISETGICFCSASPLPKGMKIVLTLTPTRSTPLKCSAIVADSTRNGDEDWRIGCEFAVPITPELLKELL